MKQRLLLSALLILSSGCGGLTPVKDISVHHVLEPLVPDRVLKASTPAIAINRPSIPSYLDRQQLVTRMEGQLMISNNDLWAEPLNSALSRVLASNLSRLTGSMNIQPVENFTALEYASLLEIRIAQFEPDSAGRMILQGTWKLQPINGHETSSHFFRFVLPTELTSSAAARVTAMNQALEKLARQIAASQ
jgi:uncharacterized protein